MQNDENFEGEMVEAAIQQSMSANTSSEETGMSCLSESEGTGTSSSSHVQCRYSLATHYSLLNCNFTYAVHRFSGDKNQSLSEAIKSLQANLLHPDDGLLHLEVRKDFLISDAICEARNKTFNTGKHIKVGC